MLYATRWTPYQLKQGYNSYEYGYSLIYPLIRPFTRVITPFITGSGGWFFHPQLREESQKYRKVERNHPGMSPKHQGMSPMGLFLAQFKIGASTSFESYCCYMDLQKPRLPDKNSLAPYNFSKVHYHSFFSTEPSFSRLVLSQKVGNAINSLDFFSGYVFIYVEYIQNICRPFRLNTRKIPIKTHPGFLTPNKRTRRFPRQCLRGSNLLTYLGKRIVLISWLF